MLKGLAVLGAGYDLSFDPRPYFEGLSSVYEKVDQRYRFYLLGEVSTEPWWYYYLVAFTLKTPLGALALLLVALGTLLLRADPAQRGAALSSVWRQRRPSKAPSSPAFLCSGVRSRVARAWGATIPASSGRPPAASSAPG